MFFISAVADSRLHAMLYWLYGDLSQSRVGPLALLALVLTLAFAVLFGYAKHLNLLTVRSDGSLFLDKKETALEELSSVLRQRAGESKETGVLIFADRDLAYQKLFYVLDEIRKAGLSRVSLQAEADERP